MPTNTLRWQFAILVVSVLVAVAKGAEAPPVAPAPQAGTQSDVKPFEPEEVEAIVAPIALYPDSLLAQIFMASTYPIEIVQVERWAAENKTLKGDALAAELNKKDWDPSVKSLIDFPQVLEMMSKQLDWTTKLGDAFIADQAAVMAAVQRLRAKAQAEGNLKTTAEQKVTVEQAPAQTVVVQGAPAPPPQIITIESTSPEVVYVPAYNPTVVYGAWPYPAYPPPPPYYPPGYVASNLVSFGVGVAVGAAWGHAWGGCNWGHGDVDIDVNRNANFNQNINRQAYANNIQNRATNIQGGNRTNIQGGNRNTFVHDSSHRKGVSYRDQASAAKVGQLPANTDAARARDSYRGRAEAGRQDIARGATPAQLPSNRGGGVNRGASASQLPADRGGNISRGASPSQLPSDRGSANRGGGSQRGGASPSQLPSSRGGAFDGADRGGASARASSSRGQASRSAAPSRSSPSRASSGSRGGGGGRGGGGRGGGRR